MFFTLVLILIIAAAIYRGYLFVDFQIQVGSFLWGKRLGVKRRSGFVFTATKEDVQ